MITKLWAISQIKKKWIEYLKRDEELHETELHPFDRFQQSRQAHREYYRVMLPLKDKFSIRYYELRQILREAEQEMENEV